MGHVKKHAPTRDSNDCLIRLLNSASTLTMHLTKQTTTMATKSPTMHFACEAHRKSYERGLREVKAKLASAPRRPTAEMIHQKSMAEGLTAVAVIKQMSALQKSGGMAAPATPAQTSASTSAKHHVARPAKSKRVYHNYCMQRGLFA